MQRKEEKHGWADSSKEANHLFFSELDVLMRALDRFFNIDNLAYSSDDLTIRDFYEELVTVRDTILRMLGILEVVIPENRRNAYWLLKFAETKLLSAQGRDNFREDIYRQDTPEKSLYSLYDFFTNLKGIISDLLRTGAISYVSFMNIGRLIGKEIRENVYFNPFARSLNPEFDAIANLKISSIVKSIEPKDIRKYLSVVYIYLFRFLRFMEFIDIEAQRPGSLNVSLAILILLKAETTAFQGYIEEAVNKISDHELRGSLKSISYQFSMENRRVFLQELRDIQRKKASPDFKGKIENCRGILKNVTEQTIVQLAQHFMPEISGEEIFSSFVTKTEQSIRLLEDVMVLHKFTTIIDENTDNADDKLRVFESMRNYMLYFEGFTFRLLRHDDYEEFVMFFNEIRSDGQGLGTGPGFKKQLDTVRQFKIYLETTLRHIGNRAELKDKEVGTGRIDSLIGQYM